jgi:hypothetical protein
MVITTDWLFTVNQDIASRFIWSRKKKMSPAYVRWVYSKLAINDNEQEAAWEVSMAFLTDVANAFEGKTFEDEQKAMNYVFRSFQKWFWKKIDRTPSLRNHYVSIDEIPPIGETQMNEESRMEEIVGFVKERGPEAEFFMRYLLMTKEEQGTYWEGRKRISYLGKVVSKQTFYNRLGAFKKGLRGHLEKNK